MARRKIRRPLYRRVTVSAKLTPGKHDDLIAKWEAIPEGERQTWLIQAMRLAANSDSTESRVARIEQLVSGLPGIIQEAIRAIPAVVMGGAAAPAVEAAQSQEEMAARDKAMAKSRWNKF